MSNIMFNLCVSQTIGIYCRLWMCCFRFRHSMLHLQHIGWTVAVPVWPAPVAVAVPVWLVQGPVWPVPVPEAAPQVKIA